MLPGMLAWAILLSVIGLSWKLPAAVAVFIILFDVYWLLKTIYLLFHLRASYMNMRRQLKTDWMAMLSGTRWQEIYHLVILPMYNEPYELVRDTFEHLKHNRYPKQNMIVVLAAEERKRAETIATVSRIQREYGEEFFKFLVSWHPDNIAGEIAGKGSNSAWAAKQARHLIDEAGIPYENILVSVFDADTQVFPDYFGCLTWNFLTCEKPQRSSFQPIPFFTNNIYQTSMLGRVVAFSSTFWQMIMQSRSHALVTFSSHSMPFRALVEIGYWQTDVVSEDSRIFWQCLIHYHGDWRVVPLTYPVSMDANVAPSLWHTFKNLYKQQRRWAYGAENVAYMLNGFRRDPLIPLKQKLFWIIMQIESYRSWATDSLLIFALGWLPILIGGPVFKETLLSYNLPGTTRTIMTISGIGIATSAILSIMLLPKKPDWFRPYHYLGYVAQWLLTPITLIFFGCLPAIEAQTRLLLGGKFKLGFWVTPKTRAIPGGSVSETR